MDVNQIATAAQIVSAMKEAVERLEKAIKHQRGDDIVKIKKELLALQENFAQLI